MAKKTAEAKVKSSPKAPKPAGAGKKAVVVKSAKPAAGKVAKPVKPVKPTKPAAVKVAATKPAKPARTAASAAKAASPKPGNNGTSLPDFKASTRREVVHEQPLTEDQLRKVKSGLTKRDLEHYRQLLIEKRNELLGDVESLRTDARNNSGGNLSHMPVHMADVGSDNYEQEFTLGLVETDNRLIREINEALERMNKGYYGVCVERGIPIARARLDAKPWAKYCIEVVRERERRGLR